MARKKRKENVQVKDQTYQKKDFLHGFGELAQGECFPYTEKYQKQAQGKSYFNRQAKQGQVLDLNNARRAIQECFDRIRKIGASAVLSQAGDANQENNVVLEDSAGGELTASMLHQKLNELNKRSMQPDRMYDGHEFKFQYDQQQKVINVFCDGQPFVKSDQVYLGNGFDNIIKAVNEKVNDAIRKSNQKRENERKSEMVKRAQKEKKSQKAAQKTGDEGKKTGNDGNGSGNDKQETDGQATGAKGFDATKVPPANADSNFVYNATNGQGVQQTHVKEEGGSEQQKKASRDINLNTNISVQGENAEIEGVKFSNSNK